MMKQVLIFFLCFAIVACTDTQKDQNVADNSEVQGRGGGKDEWWQALPRKEWKQYVQVPTTQTWFEVYKVFEGVYAIYEPGQFEEVISYLILGQKESLLFDTGLGIGDIKKLVRELTELPIMVVNSHTHYDHIGGNYQFDSIYTSSSHFAIDNAKGRDHKSVAEFVGEGWIWKSLPEGFDKDEYCIRPFKITNYLDDGDIIDLAF